MIDASAFVLGTYPVPRTGRHKLAGTVTVDGLPASRVIGVFNRKTLKWVAAAKSDPNTGAWEIIGLPEYQENSLFVLAFDDTGNYNAEVADYISQVATV